MWDAIQADLADFVSTIQSDASKVILSNQENGAEKSADDAQVLEKQRISDLKCSIITFEKPIELEYAQKFDKFIRTFSLSAYSSSIAQLLDEEVDIARSYASLVPEIIPPKIFWGRYFFRFLLITKGAGNGNDEGEDEDDDEVLSWEVEEGKDTMTSDDRAIENTVSDSTKKASSEKKTTSYSQLLDENQLLKNHIKALTNRVSELETVVQEYQDGNSGDDGNKHFIMINKSAPDSSANASNNGALSVVGVVESTPVNPDAAAAIKTIPASTEASNWAKSTKVGTTEVHSLASLENEEGDEEDGAWDD